MTWRFLLSLVVGFTIVTSASGQDSRAVYKGRWTSDSTGHSGPMRATVTPRANGEYDARFTGRFAGVIPFTYKTTLTPIACDDCGMTVSANKKLGPILGSYQMSGGLTPSQFQAGFQAGKDAGQFRMQRVR